jgi:hypothetical protein
MSVLNNPLWVAFKLFSKCLGLAPIQVDVVPRDFVQVVDPGFLRIMDEAHDRCFL